MLDRGPTKPLAGVITTSPHTAPVAVARALGRPFCSQLSAIQVRAAAAAAVLVVTNALTARGEAAKALPALKPNQPNQSRAAPRMVSGTLLASVASPFLKPIRFPTIMAAARAANPELAWTTVPPAKSSAPSLCSHPSGFHTQCAIGS